MEIKLMLFQALIQSQLQYVISIWGRTSESILAPLVKLQKKSLRVVMGANWVDHCDPLFYKANCLKLSDMHELSCCKLAYKITHKDAPVGIINLFHPQIDRSRRYETFPQLRVPFGRLKVTQNLPSYQVPLLWNAIPKDINMKSIDTFQKHYKRYKMLQYNSFVCTDPLCYPCKILK